MKTLAGITVMAIDTKPRLGIRKRVKQRVATGLCLHCDAEATRLGLCNRHYAQFRIERLKRPEAERALWEARQVRAGKVLRTRQGQRVDLKNPFNDEA